MRLAIIAMVGLAVGITIMAVAYMIIQQIDIKGEVDNFHIGYTSELNKTQFMRLELDDLVVALADYTQDCRAEADYDLKVHVVSDEVLSKGLIFEKLKVISWCHSLQSAENECGLREDLNDFANVTLPAIIIVSCYEKKLTIKT